jgi:hypothetical protein
MRLLMAAVAIGAAVASPASASPLRGCWQDGAVLLSALADLHGERNHAPLQPGTDWLFAARNEISGSWTVISLDAVGRACVLYAEEGEP